LHYETNVPIIDQFLDYEINPENIMIRLKNGFGMSYILSGRMHKYLYN